MRRAIEAIKLTIGQQCASAVALPNLVLCIQSSWDQVVSVSVRQMSVKFVSFIPFM